MVGKDDDDPQRWAKDLLENLSGPTPPSMLLEDSLLTPAPLHEDFADFGSGDFQGRAMQMLQELVEGQRRIERQLRTSQSRKASLLSTGHARAAGDLSQATRSLSKAQEPLGIDKQKSTATDGVSSFVPSPADNSHVSSEVMEQIKFTGLENSLANVHRVLMQIKSLAPRHSSRRILLVGGTSSIDMLERSSTEELGSSSRCILHPDSPFWGAWDMLGAILLLYDSVQIPFVISFSVRSQGFWRVMTVLTFAFWLVDLLLGFFSGYHTALGEVVMNRKFILRNFLRGNFLPNFVAVSMDAVGILVDNMVVGDATWSGNSFFTVLLRFVRLPRILRLMLVLRSGRLADLYDTICRWLDSRNLGHQSFSVILTVLKLVLAILWVTHLVACLWHVVGKCAREAYYQGWEKAPEEDDVWLNYLHAYLWSTNILVAAAGIHPPFEALELCVTIGTMLVGFMGSSTVIGIISDTLMASRTTSAERLQRLERLQKYLAQSHVPPVFAVCVEKQATQLYSTNRILEEDVDLLKNLSQKMRELLSSIVWSPAVCTQQFIRQCEMVSRVFLHNVCSLALEKSVLPPGTFLLDHGSSSPGAFFVNWGRLEYHRPSVHESSEEQLDDVRSMLLSSGIQVKPSRQHVEVTRSCDEIQPCTWIYEIALFCNWSSCGALCAASLCEALTIKGDVLMSICSQDAIIRPVAQDYAANLCRAIRQHPELMTSELYLPVAHEEVLPLLQVESRKVLSFAGWDLLKGAQQMFVRSWSMGVQHSLVNRLHLKVGGEPGEARARGAPESLVSEIDSGACDLVVQSSMRSWDARPEEAVLRVVSLVALRLERMDGRICVQLGRLKRDGGKLRVDADVKLPGAKVLAGELPSDTMSRLIREKLSGLWGRMTVTSKSRDLSEKLSEVYKVKTSYIRHVVSALFDDSGDEWLLACGAQRKEWRQDSHHHLDQMVRWNSHRVLHTPDLDDTFILDPTVESKPLVFAWVAASEVESEHFAEESKDWMSHRSLF